MIGCSSWHKMLCGDDAHTMSIRMVWVKCTTSAEWNSIWIAESSVMDGWDDRRLAQCRFCFQKWISEKWRKCRTEYSEGTDVARAWFGVPGGYCRRRKVVMCDWPELIRRVVMFDWPPALLLKMSSPFPRAFTKDVLQKLFFNKDIEMSYDTLYRHVKLTR
jgi:hypothetical protein